MVAQPRNGSRSLPPTRRSGLSWVLRSVALCALASGSLALAESGYASLPHAVRARGLRTEGTTVRWLDPPGLAARRALLLASQPGGPDDVYVASARTGSGDMVVELGNLSNLTRSPYAQEEMLTSAGPWAAFATRVGNRYVAFTLIDTRGAEDSADAPADTGARVRDAISRWQQTGHARGYGVYRYDLDPPAQQLALTLNETTLTATVDGRAVRVDVSSRAVQEGEQWVHLRPRLSGTTGWTTWFVDTVRAIPWIGPAPITWAEHRAYSLLHYFARARVGIVGDTSQREVAEDLADLSGGAHRAGDLEGPVADWPPARLQPLYQPVLPHEGEWVSAADDDPFIARNPGAPSAFYQTFIRTDRQRPDTRVYVTLWDARQVELHVVPGSTEPMGATGETGSGSIPRDPRTLTRLAAGFNGGFQALHGEWGVMAEGILFLPPKAWGATITVLDDGRTGFGSWPQDVSTIPENVVELRQNLTSLVEDGVFNPYRRTFWGGTAPGSPEGETHTARTGLCMTREGHVAFFWGSALTERTLADGMTAARCTYGIHLDMNGANTGFEFLRVTPSGSTPTLQRPIAGAYESEGPVPSAPAFTYRARRMVRGMHEMGFPRYIKRDPRDFFYLMLRNVLPGAPIRAVAPNPEPEEGQWHVGGLGSTVFPWPMARTRIRPDPAQVDRWVHLVRVDARRVTLRPDTETEHVVARLVGARPARPSMPRVSWQLVHDHPRWTIGTEGDGLEGTFLTPGATATRAVGIDADGYLVFAVADRPIPDLVGLALDRAGCGPQRLALSPTAAISIGGARDAAGAAIAPNATTAFTLVERAMPGAERMFSNVRPVPPDVWFDAQHRRVRYGRSEDGNVEVRVLGGRAVQVREWGGHSPTGAPGAAPTPPPP